MSVPRLATVLSISVNAATRLLEAIAVPTMSLRSTRYFMVTALEEALYLLLEPGGPGLVAPGSYDKRTKCTAQLKQATAMPKELCSPANRDRVRKICASARADLRTRKQGELQEKLRKGSQKNGSK
jgi:hypothetical protein